MHLHMATASGQMHRLLWLPCPADYRMGDWKGEGLSTLMPSL